MAKALGGTAIQSPHFFGHAVSIAFRVEGEANEEAVRERWRAAPGLKLLDTPAERIYPMPLLAAGDPSVLVGRLHALPSSPGWLSAFAVVDNAGRGAALNALEVGEALVRRP